MSRKHPHDAESIGQILEQVYLPGLGLIKKMISEDQQNKTKLIRNVFQKPVLKSENRFGRFNNVEKRF